MIRERDIERQLVRGVKELGGLCYKFTSPGNVGVPDRICIYPGGLVHFVELKRPGGKLSAEQIVQRNRIIKLGGVSLVLESSEAVAFYLETMRKKGGGAR